MSKLEIKKLNKTINSTISNIASDKSISHRCAIFSLLSDKPSIIKNFLLAEDTLDSLNIASKLGAKVLKDGANITITPPKSLCEPDDILDCGNAGTGIRLYMGFLSSHSGSFVLTGDKYLRNRPMNRITKPLRDIGATIDGKENGNKAPIHIRGNKLKSFKYHSAIDSAQVKSALILASLHSDDISFYKENNLSRDHTERMLKGMGVDIQNTEDGWIKIQPIKAPLKPLNITVPADPSSAFFFAVAAAIVPNSKIILKNVSLNKTRIEAYKILEKMGTKITYDLKEDVYEPIGDICVEYSQLNGITIDNNLAWIIDEIPAISIAMSIANGASTIKNAKELRVKESDRISSMVQNLELCGISCDEFEDGYTIKGNQTFKHATINSYGDHRIAMSFCIAGLLCDMTVEDTSCIDTSFPEFHSILKGL